MTWCAQWLGSVIPFPHSSNRAMEFWSATMVKPERLKTSERHITCLLPSASQIRSTCEHIRAPRQPRSSSSDGRNKKWTASSLAAGSQATSAIRLE
jgi:hypothetical protein